MCHLLSLAGHATQVVKGEASVDEGFGEKVARLPKVDADSLIIIIDE